MLRKLRPRSVYDVMAAIACFGVLAGGSAYAAATITGADVVNDSLTGEDVQGRGGSAPVNGSLTSAEIGGQAANPATGTPFVEGTLTQWDIKNGTLGSDDVANNSLTGADIKDGSGVETCPAPATLKFGPICAGSDGGARTWRNALNYCAGLRLRLPSNSEAVTLAKNHDVPGVGIGTFESFWTDEAFIVEPSPGAGNQHFGGAVDEAGVFIFAPHSDTWRTVCVTDPSA
jgi:hypothetical protein